MIAAETVAQAREGDAVKIGTRSQTWQSPMTVAETDTVEWDVPFGEDWTTATLRLESAQTAFYAIVDSHGESDAGLYRTTHTDDVGRRIGPLGTFDIVDSDQEDSDPVVTPSEDPWPCVRRRVWRCPECEQGYKSELHRDNHVEREHASDEDGEDDDSPPLPPRFRDYNASTSTKRTCQNCGAHVPKDYARVFTEDGGAVEVCENCPDKIREGDGTVRDKKYVRGGVQ